MTVRTTDPHRWPPLPWDEWGETCLTLQLWTQIVGKVKLALTPFLNEWWQIAFHLTARGMTTGLIPYQHRTFEVDFDFVEHRLLMRTDDGTTRTLTLAPRSVADFYTEFMGALRAIGILVEINTLPTEVPDPIPFDRDRVHASYDPDPVNRWWRIQVSTQRVLQRYRSTFVGKSSPIHFYWGSFDLNHTRFSGRPAPPLQGVPRFLRIAEDQENHSVGFWPGNPNAAGVTLGEAAYYSYIYPAQVGCDAASVSPLSASFDPSLGEFLLRYDDVRRAESPEDDLLRFFQTTYDVAAHLAGWDRAAIEKAPPQY